MAIKLTKVAPGHYQTQAGNFDVIRHVVHGSGEVRWIVRDARGARVDSFGSLREARPALESLERRAWWQKQHDYTTASAIEWHASAMHELARHGIGAESLASVFARQAGDHYGASRVSANVLARSA